MRDFLYTKQISYDIYNLSFTPDAFSLYFWQELLLLLVEYENVCSTYQSSFITFTE